MTCAKCGEERKIRARGLCGGCYEKCRLDGSHLEFESKYKPGERPCAQCGETTLIAQKDMCRPCFDRTRTVGEQSRRKVVSAVRRGRCMSTHCGAPALPDCHPSFRFCQRCLDRVHLLITTDKGTEHLPDDWAPTPGTRAILPGSGLKQKVRNR